MAPSTAARIRYEVSSAVSILHMAGVTVWLQGARCLFGEGLRSWCVLYC
jgi:hypothetical protein